MWADSESFDIEGLGATKVTVYSWDHSGPVSVDMEGVNVNQILDAIPDELISGYLNKKGGDK